MEVRRLHVTRVRYINGLGVHVTFIDIGLDDLPAFKKILLKENDDIFAEVARPETMFRDMPYDGEIKPDKAFKLRTVWTVEQDITVEEAVEIAIDRAANKKRYVETWDGKFRT